MIEVRDLTKRYGNIEALRGVSFRVETGQVVGLLGPNGAGKSTAMRILTGYVAPTTGTALVDDRDVFEDPVEAQRKIGYLPEGNPLYLDLRLSESLRFAARMFGLRGDEVDRAVDEASRLAGLSNEGNRVLGTLSKGYRQRAGLAQALLHKPPILILDEPTSGLDPIQQEEMRNLIRSLGKERTVILSTHILPEVEAVCDRVLIISKGRLVADGSVAQIRSQAGGGASATVTVRADAELALSTFRALDFARGVDVKADGTGLVSLSIRMEGSASPDRMERIAGAAARAGLPLSRLAAETASLERVFQELTSGQVPEPAEAAPVAAGTEGAR